MNCEKFRELVKGIFPPGSSNVVPLDAALDAVYQHKKSCAECGVWFAENYEKPAQKEVSRLMIAVFLGLFPRTADRDEED